MRDIKVTPELLVRLQVAQFKQSGFTIGRHKGVRIKAMELTALIAEIRHQWAGGWTRITDDASLPEVGREVVICSHHNGHISGTIKRSEGDGAGDWVWRIGDNWRYATPMPGEG